MGRPAAIELAPGLWRIPTTPGDLVNAFALRDADGQVTLVDCGYRFGARRILAALGAIGSAPADVTRILLTHAHNDHAGGLARVQARTGAAVAVHEREAANVRSGRPPEVDRSTTAGRMWSRLPDGFTPAQVHQELTGGETLPLAGGVRVVHTPGHTPGHVALLHLPSRTLLTGDSLFNWTGRRMALPSLSYCSDAAAVRTSAALLGELDYDTVAFTHGPEIRAGAREAVRGFLRSAGLR